ncbi:TPA: pyridoxal 5'-phosphate synthase lyase subunit PdxS, partial [Listeria monocytogenes]
MDGEFNIQLAVCKKWLLAYHNNQENSIKLMEVVNMEKKVGTDRVKRGMAQMQKGGVIMDVVNAEQAK